MHANRTRRTTLAGLTLFALIGWSGVADAQWTALTNAPPAFLDTCVLLTDGRVMCHQYFSNTFHLLTPDINGSYRNGTWSTTATMPNGTDLSFGCNPCTYQPLYYYSGVLADGRVVVVGGEYNAPGGSVWTNMGFLYDPVTDTWSSQLTVPFAGGCIGDAQGIILDDGTLLLADSVCSRNIAAFDPVTLTFTALGLPNNKQDSNNEENWNILPDGTVLTVDSRIASQFEIYDPGTNMWTFGSTPVNLADTGPGVGSSSEIGPGVLRPDGTLIYFSGNSLGQNALYDTVMGTWSNTSAMDFPLVPGQTYHYSVADGVASLLPNGNVLVMGSPTINGSPFNSPSHFWEFDYATDSLISVTDSPNAASFAAYQGRMLLLPTGEVLLSAYNQGAIQDVLLYSNGGGPQDEWRPTITSCLGPVEPGETYAISGTLFNGFSEGATYGDDAAMSTNYPLVRITNMGTGHVFYCRTYDHSRMGVQLVGSTEIVTTVFDTPVGLEAGPSKLEVVVNGIASIPITINDGHSPSCDVGGPYLAECEGTTTSIQLDGSGSMDPNPDHSISYLWTSDCPGATFDDDTSDTPILTVDSTGPCPLECTVTLTVTDCAGVSEQCETDVTVEDTTDPEITCPSGVTITCGDSILPAVLGMATSTDECDPSPAISYADTEVAKTCAADPVQKVITRTWTAIDACGNDSDCAQTITVLKVVLAVDIKPGSCPNGFNPKSQGILPVSVLGTDTFDVSSIDPSSVRISLADCPTNTVAPERYRYQDAGTPFEAETTCDCHDLTGDGLTDLSLFFKTSDVVAALGLDSMAKGSSVELAISGELDDGCQFISYDCVTHAPGANK